MQYRKEVDGLRAVAVLPVILFHAGYQLFGGGFVGVDIFFVISGYLITSILIGELDSGKFSIIGFYERRARRILPALFFVMLVCLPFAWHWLMPADMKSFAQSMAAVPVFGSNILFWRQSGYFDLDAELKPLLHTWSLGVEEQFYVLFPLFLWCMWSQNRRWLLAALAVISLLSLGSAEWGIRNDPIPAFFLLPPRGWELAIGAFCAFYLSKAKADNQTRLPHQLLSLAGLALIAVSIFAFDKSTPFPGLYALVPTLGTALVILFAMPCNAAGRLLGSKYLVGIGLLSYSAYLWHQPVIAFARHRSLGEPAHALIPALVILVFILAYLSWRFVEQPFRQKGKFSRRQVFALSFAGSVAMISLGLAGNQTDGFKTVRTSPQQLQVMATAQASPTRTTCHRTRQAQVIPPEACKYNSSNPEWAVLGDSHGIELAYALAKELAPLRQGVHEFTFSACGPAYHLRSQTLGCSQWTDDAVEYIAAQPAIRNVVLSYRLHASLFGGHERVYPALPAKYSPAEREAVWQSLQEIMQRMLAAGKTVTLVLQAPEIPKRVDQLIWLHNDPQTVEGVDLDWWRKRSEFVEKRLAGLPAKVHIVRPDRHFCDQAQCYAIRDGQALYVDDDHMSLAAARHVARDLLDELAVHGGQPPSRATGEIASR